LLSGKTTAPLIEKRSRRKGDIFLSILATRNAETRKKQKEKKKRKKGGDRGEIMLLRLLSRLLLSLLSVLFSTSLALGVPWADGGGVLPAQRQDEPQKPLYWRKNECNKLRILYDRTGIFFLFFFLL
jgi:hypothetical protein